MLVVPQVGARQLLELGLAGLDEPVNFHLFQNDLAPTVFSVLGDFTEATYTGYAVQEVDTTSDLTYFLQPDGSVVAGAASQLWTPTGPGVANEIFGYYVTQGTSPALLWAERFAESKVLAGVGTGFTLVPSIGGQTAVG